MTKITGTIYAEGTLQGTLSAAFTLVGTITAGKSYYQDYATDADILALFKGGNIDGI